MRSIDNEYLHLLCVITVCVFDGENLDSLTPLPATRYIRSYKGLVSVITKVIYNGE